MASRSKFAIAISIASSIFGCPLMAEAEDLMSEIVAKSNKTSGEYKLKIDNQGDSDTLGSITQGAGGIVAQQGNSVNSKMIIQDSTAQSKLDTHIRNSGGSTSGGSIMLGVGGQVYQQN